MEQKIQLTVARTNGVQFSHITDRLVVLALVQLLSDVRTSSFALAPPGYKVADAALEL